MHVSLYLVLFYDYTIPINKIHPIYVEWGEALWKRQFVSHMAQNLISSVPCTDQNFDIVPLWLSHFHHIKCITLDNNGFPISVRYRSLLPNEVKLVIDSLTHIHYLSLVMVQVHTVVASLLHCVGSARNISSPRRLLLSLKSYLEIVFHHHHHLSSSHMGYRNRSHGSSENTEGEWDMVAPPLRRSYPPPPLLGGCRRLLLSYVLLLLLLL